MKKLCSIFLGLFVVVFLQIGKSGFEIQQNSSEIAGVVISSNDDKDFLVSQQISSSNDPCVAVPLRVQVMQEHYQRVLLKKYSYTQFLFSLFEYLHHQVGRTESFQVIVSKFPLSHCLDFLRFNVLII